MTIHAPGWRVSTASTAVSRRPVTGGSRRSSISPISPAWLSQPLPGVCSRRRSTTFASWSRSRRSGSAALRCSFPGRSASAWRLEPPSPRTLSPYEPCGSAPRTRRAFSASCWRSVSSADRASPRPGQRWLRRSPLQAVRPRRRAVPCRRARGTRIARTGNPCRRPGVHGRARGRHPAIPPGRSGRDVVRHDQLRHRDLPASSAMAWRRSSCARTSCRARPAITRSPGLRCWSGRRSPWHWCAHSGARGRSHRSHGLRHLDVHAAVHLARVSDVVHDLAADGDRPRRAAIGRCGSGDLG